MELFNLNVFSTSQRVQTARVSALFRDQSLTSSDAAYVRARACVRVTSGLSVALVQAGQMGPWREKEMGKRLVLFWQAWSSHTSHP